ncbi:MAG TPA: hypothetical protein VGK29_10865 [Paludibaculum sp.]|jgi:hypothetical protein
MFANATWKSAAATAVLLGIMGGVQTGSACTYPDVRAGGIWLYPTATHFSMTIVNLTPYDLTSVTRSMTPNPVKVYNGDTYPYPFQNLLDPIRIAPYRSALWKSGYSGAALPQSYDGRLRFSLAMSTLTHSFEVGFAKQSGHFTMGRDGTWINLAQTKVEPATNDVWCAASTFCGGVWSTPWMAPVHSTLTTWNYNMHNLMTLTSPEFVVSLYSPDNLNIVLVVRETNNDDYHGNLLDWVDNGGSTVPGDCNR